jgi:KDO2-lipid IV(A) lauroyltransferase
MDPARTDPRVEFVGLEALLPARGRNLVVAAGHFGCFDLLALAATRCGGRTLATTYRGQRIRGLEVVLQELRGLTGVRFFERRGGVAALAALLKGGDVVLGLFVDQHAGTRGAWLPFLGRECSCSTAPAVLALRHDADLAIAICHRTGPARWRVELGPAIPTHGPDATPREVEAMTLDVNRAFEVAIRRDPANWFWVHRRWKPRPEPGPSDPERAVSGPQREAGA